MGKCVKIEMADDGSFSVGLDPDYDKEEGGGAAPPDASAAAAPGGAPDAGAEGTPGEEAGESADQEQQEEPMQPARNLDDALKMAKKLLEQPADEAGNNPFETGFAQARGTPMPGGAAPGGY